MFEASLIPMAAAVEELRKVPGQLNNCREELSQVYSALGRLSYMEEPLKSLRLIESRIEEEDAKASQLQKSLEAICWQYRRSEQRIMDYSEQASVTWRREKTGYYGLDWLSERLAEKII